MKGERSAVPRGNDSIVGVGLVVLSAALFGTTGTALAQVPGEVDPLSSGTLRLLLGGGLLAVVARRTWPTIRPGRGPLIVGAIGVAIYQLGFFWAVTDTGVAAGTLVTIGISPVASRLVGAVLHRPAPPRSWYLAAAILITGLTVMILGGYDDVELSAAGVVVALLAGTSFALYTECGSLALARGVSPDATMATLFLGAGLLTSPILLWRGVEIMTSWRGAAVLAHLAFVTLTVAYMAFGRGLRRLSPTVVTTLTIVEPVIATVLSFAVLNEEFSVLGWIGAATVVLGLPVVGLSSRSTRPVEPASTVRP